MARYWKLFWCNVFTAFVFVALLLSLQAMEVSDAAKAIASMGNWFWFCPLSCWLFDRQLKAEAEAGLPELILRR